MKKLVILLIVTLLSLSLSSVAVAKNKPKASIKGSGIVVNDNSGAGPGLCSRGRVNAHMNVVNANGSIKSKLVLAIDPTNGEIVWH